MEARVRILPHGIGNNWRTVSIDIPSNFENDVDKAYEWLDQHFKDKIPNTLKNDMRPPHLFRIISTHTFGR